MTDTKATLDLLGLTQEELQERVVARLCSEVTTDRSYDEDGDRYGTPSKFARELKQAVTDAIDAKVKAIAEEHVLPHVGERIEKMTLQQTNKWGEARGEPVTFVEYLVAQAEKYMEEKVDYNGKGKGHDSYGFKGTQTRLTHMVNSHLHSAIKTAMEQALATANSSIVKGLEETVKIKLAEIQKSLKMTVSSS